MKYYIVLFSLLGLAFIGSLAAVLDVQAAPAEARHWMIVYEGSKGLNFQCASTPPYADNLQQTEAEYTAYALHVEDLEVYAYVVEVEYCNLDVIYDDMFVWRFSRAVTDGHENHRHMTRGAAWVRMLDYERE